MALRPEALLGSLVATRRVLPLQRVQQMLAAFFSSAAGMIPRSAEACHRGASPARALLEGHPHRICDRPEPVHVELERILLGDPIPNVLGIAWAVCRNGRIVRGSSPEPCDDCGNEPRGC